MERLLIKVLPKHLKGNSWSHQMNPENRRCPLEEALVASGYPDAYVGAMCVILNTKELDPDDYVIMDWNEEDVQRFIEMANNGSEEQYEVELVRDPNFVSEAVVFD